MRDLVAGELSEDFDVADVDAGELSFTPPDVEEARAWQIAIRVEGAAGGESEGASATAYIDLIFLREGGCHRERPNAGRVHGI